MPICHLANGGQTHACFTAGIGLKAVNACCPTLIDVGSHGGHCSRALRLNDFFLAPVAQGIEHRFPKAGVAGSNPAGGIGFPVFHTFWKHGPKSRMTPGSMLQNLPRCFEAAVELPQINILHRDTGIYRDAGSNSGTLPNDHEHGLHANRAIRDV